MIGIKGYDEVEVLNFEELPKLPAGGYVLKIRDVRVDRTQWGEKLVLCFDIAEGEFKGFFEKLYKSTPDSWSNKKYKGTFRISIPKDEGDSDKYRKSVGFFKGQMQAFEKSNPGLKINCSSKWDERSLVGKVVGALFNEKEYDFNGKHGFFVQCKKLVEADKIRTGDFTVPKRDLLDPDSVSDTVGGQSFANSDAGDDDMPF